VNAGSRHTLKGVRSLAQKPGWPPTREQAILAVIVIAVVLGLTVGITNGPLAGITMFLGFSGVLSLALIFVPARPKVIATLRGLENAISDGETRLVIGADRTVRPFDIDQIVADEEQAARETMPRAPTPIVPKGAFGGEFDLNKSTADFLAAHTGTSDEDLRAFIKEVREYGQELRDWLEGLQTARAERLRPLVLSARVSEQGQAPADFTWLHLHFPKAFEETAQPPDVPEPPERPRFIHGVARFAVPMAAMRIRGGIRRGALRDLFTQGKEPSAARYSSENGMTVVSFQVGHINQHDHRDTGKFALRTAPPGVYEIKWRISAAGLSPQAEGKIKVEVREPITGEPIVELAEALSEREHHSLD
jgi:hypothetical protein